MRVLREYVDLTVHLHTNALPAELPVGVVADLRDMLDRNLARTLGGCPSNEVGGRFTTISVLNTAVQESFVAEVCGIGDTDGVALDRLLPQGVSADAVLDDATADAILAYQQALFLGRSPDEEEIEEARAAASQCNPAPCTASAFARPVCFALLSSSEMLFY